MSDQEQKQQPIIARVNSSDNDSDNEATEKPTVYQLGKAQTTRGAAAQVAPMFHPTVSSIMHDDIDQQPSITLNPFPSVLDISECIPIKEFDNVNEMVSSLNAFFTNQGAYFVFDPSTATVAGDYYCTTTASRISFQLVVYLQETQLVADLRRVDGCGISFSRFFSSFFSHFGAQQRTICTFTAPPLLALSREQQKEQDENNNDEQEAVVGEMNFGIHILESILTAQPDTSNESIAQDEHDPIRASAAGLQPLSPADQTMLMRGLDCIALPLYAVIYPPQDISQQQLTSFQRSLEQHVSPFLVHLLTQMNAILQPELYPLPQDVQQYNIEALTILQSFDNFRVASSFYQLLQLAYFFSTRDTEHVDLFNALKALPWKDIAANFNASVGPNMLESWEVQRLKDIIDGMAGSF